MELFGQERLAAMQQAGLKLARQPVLTRDEVMVWSNWKTGKTHRPTTSANVVVDVENEEVVIRGKTYQLDRTLALIAKCLIDANGEIRSTTDIKNTFPDEAWEDRLDLTINRKLMRHPSGIGDLIESVGKKGYRLRE
jgi:DNA-binding response OmpR family regulator